jgi:hypothetical protein
MGFTDLVEEKVSSSCEEGLEKVRQHPRHFQWGFQTLGDIGLSVSGLLTQNYGRAATGILGTVRDASFFPLRKVLAGSHAETICSVVALGTNMPQLLRSASPPETAAAALVMTGWTLKAMPGLLHGLSSESVHEFISRPVQSLKDNFAGASATLFGTMPAAIFATRGAMQMADGITRRDPSAMAAGLCFIFGGVAGYYAGRKHLTPPVPAGDADNGKNDVPRPGI